MVRSKACLILVENLFSIWRDSLQPLIPAANCSSHSSKYKQHIQRWPQQQQQWLKCPSWICTGDFTVEYRTRAFSAVHHCCCCWCCDHLCASRYTHCIELRLLAGHEPGVDWSNPLTLADRMPVIMYIFTMQLSNSVCPSVLSCIKCK